MKSGSLPAKADVAKQRRFWDDILRPLLRRARQGKIVLLFMDASHFVMGCDFLGYLYGRVRRFVKTYSGRRRYNVLGAMNYISKKTTTVTNDTYITATEVCLLLRSVASEYAGKTIFIVLDNARYQKCEVIRATAKEFGIQLVFIPPYSPNLNLIERLWKFVKNALRSQYYNQFDVFQKKIDSVIDIPLTGTRILLINSSVDGSNCLTTYCP